MIQKSQSIVIKNTRYGETGLIVQGYTDLYGKQSFIVNGIGKKHSKFKSALFHQLSIIEVVFYSSTKSGLRLLKEISIPIPLIQIQTSIIKNTIAQFIAEVLYKTLHEDVANQTKFTFLSSSILYLEHLQKNISQFHIVFLVLYSKHLGIFPQNNITSTSKYFNFSSGSFVFFCDAYCFNYEESHLFAQSIEYNFSNYDMIKLTQLQRKSLLNMWLKLYSYHISGFKNIETLSILEEIFL